MQSVITSGIYLPTWTFITAGDPRKSGFLERIRQNAFKITAGITFTCALHIMFGPFVAIPGIFMIYVCFQVIEHPISTKNIVKTNLKNIWTGFKTHCSRCWASVKDAVEEIISDFQEVDCECKESDDTIPIIITMVDFDEDDLNSQKTQPQKHMPINIQIDEKAVIQRTLTQSREANTLTEKSLKSLYKGFKKIIDADPALKDEIRRDAIKHRQTQGRKNRRTAGGLVVPMSQSTIEWLEN